MPHTTERQSTIESISSMICDIDTAQIEEELDKLLESSDDDSSTVDSESDSDAEQIEGSGTIVEDLLDYLQLIISRRYMHERGRIEKSSNLFILHMYTYRFTRPALFRSAFRLDPTTFDALVAAISDHPVFHNSSNNPQLPVEWQLAITLFRFGHYGNAASVGKIATWFGIGVGTVDLCTRRVIRVVCSDNFRQSAIHWATPSEKQSSQNWVEEHSCPAWRPGWLMVDGSLVPLYCRPGFYGNNWFDRKSNYSLNVQLISLADSLIIIDYGIGLPGSQHDATAWKKTRLPNEHAELLEDEEWIWADSAYPIQKWCIAPYKKPEKLQPENQCFNYHVSAVRIRSEHCVGFWKGRFPSLRGLRLAINNTSQLLYATYWVTATVALHNFAIRHESIEDYSLDTFFEEGMRDLAADRAQMTNDIELTERQAIAEENARADRRDIDLLTAKIKREEVKAALFEFLDNN